MSNDKATQEIRNSTLSYLRKGFMNQDDAAKVLSYLDFIDMAMSLANARYEEYVFDEMR